MGDGVRVGVDIGGTFTDLVAINDETLVTDKIPSTPTAPDEAVTRGLESMTTTTDFDTGDISFLAHGTTVGTNAVLEEAWATTGLLTTAGFRDVLEIGRQARPDIYDLHAEKPDPIVDRHHRIGVRERVDERGSVLTPLDESAVRDAPASFRDVDSVAVCFLFAFENAIHEERAAEILRDELDIPVTVSSAVHPEIREYERTVTTALNAGLRPIVDNYLDRLTTNLTDIGVEASLTIMGSNGGVMTADTARTRPVTTLLSGPAAGVKGATHLAEESGVTDLVTMDMGGTSCDVSLVAGGNPTISTEVTVGEYPIGVPMIDIHTVGAGGGSIAWIDDGGALRVGPQSAGAAPGPVCYGRGGDRPTTTDAHVLLGRINPDRLLDDPSDRSRVESVFRTELADPLEMSLEEAAAGVLSVANANMERAIRVVSVERGHDPRGFTLLAYGGAGPLHAPTLADALDMPRVLIPPRAGVLSAVGLLVSDIRYTVSTSMVRPWSSLDADTLESVFDDLRADAKETLARADIPPRDRSYERVLDLRYDGQSFDLSVPVPTDIETADLSTIADRFHDQHRDRYGHAAPAESIELVTVRLRARGQVDTPELDTGSPNGELDEAISGTRSVRFDDGVEDTRVYDRTRLPYDIEFAGPAIVEDDQSTTVIHPHHEATVDDHGNLIIEVDP